MLHAHNKIKHHLENNQPHIDKKAALWTAISMSVILLLLLFFGFKAVQEEEEMGMLINFGNTDTGQGNVEPAKATPPPKVTPPPPTPKPQVETPSAPKEEIETQDFEEAAAIAAAKKKEKERKLKEEKDRQIERQKEIDRQKEIKRQEEETERQRLEVERLEQERIEQERLAQEAKAEAIRQQTSNAFGKTNNPSEGQGVAGGEGNQGGTNGSTESNNYKGSGLGTNGNWSLAGRNLVGALPKPNFKLQKEGIVVVEISVDKTGKVTNATPILRGSTTQDSQLWKLAKEAALKAQFNANPGAQAKQVGTITYHFVLN